MKKIYLLVTIAFLAISSTTQAQYINSGFETWTTDQPDGWVGGATNIHSDSLNQYTANVHGGTSACQLMNVTTSHKRFSSEDVALVSGNAYSITFWVRGHGDIRTGWYDGGSGYNYNSYLTINSSSWTKYSQVFSCDTNTSVAEIIFSVRNTNADIDHLQIDDVVVNDTTISSTTIYNIQYTTDPSGNSPLLSSVITTTGIVTATSSGAYFLQDVEGAWNGVYVYDSGHSPALGDNITITATVDEYYNLTELKTVSVYALNSSGNTLPDPSIVTPLEAEMEDYEGVLVKLQNVTCTNTNAGNGMWEVSDGANTVLIDDVIYAFTPTLNAHYDITGVCYYSYSERKVLPRYAADVTLASGMDDNAISTLSIYPNPASSVITVNTNNNIDKVVISNLLGENLIIHYTNASVSTDINISTLPAGIYLIVVYNANGLVSTAKFSKQ